MNSRWLLIFCLWVAITFIAPSGNATASGKYKYAFLSVNDNKQAELGIIDASSPQAPAEMRPLETPPQSIISYALGSPNGEWIAFFIFSYKAHLDTVRLLNLTSGETRDIATGSFPYSWELRGFSGPDQDIVWSPDSRHLALNMVQSGNLDVFIYSLADSRLIDLTSTEQSSHFRVAWSQNSKQIATVSEYCPNPNKCVHKLEAFDIATKAQTSSVDISDRSIGSGALGTVACNFNWSPDGRYVSFVSACNTLVTRPEEVYLWDMAQSNISQVTNFTVEYSKDKATQYIFSDYAMFWYDAGTLLIGASFSNDPSTVHTQTVMYQLPSKSIIEISSGTADEWIEEPVSKTLAFRNIPIRLVGNGAQNSSLQTGSIQGNTLQSKTSLNAGAAFQHCNLAWSPDSFFLAYSLRPNSCVDKPERIGFLERTTGKAIEHVLSPTEQPGSDGVLPIGWVETKGP